MVNATLVAPTPHAVRAPGLPRERESPIVYLVSMSRAWNGPQRWLPLLGLLAPLACSNDEGSTSDGGAEDGTTLDSTEDSFLPGVDAADVGCSVACSSDLHSVLDCNGTVLQTCPPDQGCGPGGSCVPACESAKFNDSNVGCDYYSVDPDFLHDDLGRVLVGACFAAFVANTWTTPVTLTADWGGTPLSLAGAARVPSGSGTALSYQPLTGGLLQPGQVAIVFLNRFDTTDGGDPGLDCPTGVTPGVTSADGAIHGTGYGTAFHITSDRPVAAYDIAPFGGGESAITSATLLLPTSAWGTNYVGVDAYAESTVAGSYKQPFIEVVAATDNTTVTISPTAAIIAGNGVAGTSKDAPQGYTLNKGQYLQITQDEELIGSPILADKPVGVWGGSKCINIDIGDTACDAAHQQLFPVSALGHEYLGVRYRNRYDGHEEVVPWRIVGAVDGTVLTYEPSTPPGAPLSTNRKHVDLFWSSGPFVVRSQDDAHPFYMGAHMTGANHPGAGGTTGRGDPEWVNVVPPQEDLSSYVFFTDPTYPETNLVVTRTKGPSGFADVKLDCMSGPLAAWQPLGTSGQYEYTRTDLVRGDFTKQGNCDNGRHEMKSDLPFGVTVWGWGTELSSVQSTYVSYAYPAGASLRPINAVVVAATPN